MILALISGLTRTGDDLIDYVNQSGAQVIAATGLANLNPNSTYRFAENLFAVRTQGLETEVTARAPLGPGRRLDGSVGYTYVHLSNQSGVESQYLSNVARHLVAGNVSLTTRRVNVALSGLYKRRNAQETAPSPTSIGSVLTPSYAVFNARAEVALLPGRLWALGQVQNLFDARYADLLGAQMPGRWLMGGVRVALAR